MIFPVILPGFDLMRTYLPTRNPLLRIVCLRALEVLILTAAGADPGRLLELDLERDRRVRPAEVAIVYTHPKDLWRSSSTAARTAMAGGEHVPLEAAPLGRQHACDAGPGRPWP